MLLKSSNNKRLIRFLTPWGRQANTWPKMRKICCVPKTKYIKFRRTEMIGQRRQRFWEQTAQQANPRIMAIKSKRRPPVNQIATRLSVPRSSDPESGEDSESDDAEAGGESSWVQSKSKHPYCLKRTVFKGHEGGVSGVAQFWTSKILHCCTKFVTYLDSHFILRTKQNVKKKLLQKSLRLQ